MRRPLDGVRAAIQGRRRVIYRSVLLPARIGLTIGLGAAAGFTRLLQSLIFGVDAGDLRTMAFAGLLLLGVAVLAATGPAVRAARSDPAKVLQGSKWE